MKERPILMNAFSVQAILAGRKTKTRRVIKPQPTGWSPSQGTDALLWYWCIAGDQDYSEERRCPYGIPGDHLWVRETWQVQRLQGPVGLEYPNILYRADSSTRLLLDKRVWDYLTDTPHWRPSIFMPRWASRIPLEITDVRVERVQAISEEDAIAEGVEPLFSDDEIHKPRYRAELDLNPMPYKNYLWHGYIGTEITIKQAESWPHQFSGYGTARGSFSSLWEKINARRGYGWELNPWVFVITFKRIEL